MLSAVGALAVPCMILAVIAIGFAKRVNVYDAFLEGAKEGMRVSVKLFPAILAVLCAVAMLRESGLMDKAVSVAAPVTDFFGIPAEVVPLAFLRPISGSGAVALLTELLGRLGADSDAGRIAAVMAGSTETTFYTLAVYYSATRVKRTRASLAAAVVGDIAGMLGAVWVCRLIF